MSVESDLTWALEYLADELPDLYLLGHAGFSTLVGGLRMTFSVDQVLEIPQQVVIQGLAAEAEAHGHYFEVTQEPKEWVARYSKQDYVYARHPVLLVAMVLAFAGEGYVPEDLP